MKKLICISDSCPQHPRLNKLGEYFASEAEVYDICWNRVGFKESSPRLFVFNTNSGYGKKVRKLMDFPRFIRFINQTIKNVKPDTIICRHWQIFFIISLLNLTNVKIIYDVCDMPSNRVIKFIEKLMLRKADIIVLASRYFKEFYTHNRIIVLENRPQKPKSTKEFISKTQTNNYSEKIRLTFLGKIRYFNIMKNLVDALKTSKKIEINFYGDGPDYSVLVEYCTLNNINNVKFYGRYSPKEIPSIYNKSDLIWCAYPNDNFNVKYAISNKYFETLAFRKPGIFSENTKIATVISDNKIGFLVNPYNTEEIAALMNQIASDRTMLDKIISNINEFNEPIYWDEYKINKGFDL